MKFLSSRLSKEDRVKAQGSQSGIDFQEALIRGLASDGGLFVPEKIPNVASPWLNQKESFLHLTNQEKHQRVGASIVAAFAEGSSLQKTALSICVDALNFDIPLKELSTSTVATAEHSLYLLELFHGPTAAFKDVGARFLASALGVVKAEKPRLVLVATSGDTGGAVAGAFFKKPMTEVIILFPKGRVSERQEKQLCAWGENIQAWAIEGSFDDCQRVVKQALASQKLREKVELISANSISLGRLIPQSIYYAVASLELFFKTGLSSRFVIPSGNLGNSVAAMVARAMGFPIGQIVLAHNANRAVVDYFETGRYEKRETIATHANAMDVGQPSNFERLLDLFGGDWNLAKSNTVATSVSDKEIEASIVSSFRDYQQVVCPHTACAMKAAKLLKGAAPVVVVSTAHAAKFESLVEPLVGGKIQVPAALAELLKRPSQVEMLSIAEAVSRLV